MVSQTLVSKLSDFKILLPLFATLVFTDEAPYVDVMYRSNRSFNMPPPPGTPRAFDFFENHCSNSPFPGQNAVQMPHARVHSGDQMPPPRGHFTGTKMTEGRRQLSNKIFINITKTEKHC